MRALVTGGAGFIGSHLVDALLARDDSVYVLDDFSTGDYRREQDAHYHQGDVANAQAVEEAFDDAEPDVCFHLAAQTSVRRSVEEPVLDATANVLGTVNVLEAARRHESRVIFASSGGAVYGDCDAPAMETDSCRPISPYGASKLAGDEYLAAHNRLYGTRHVSLRFGNVYGPRQDPHGEAGVVAIFLERLRVGAAPTIYGDGRQTRDYVYVSDVVTATLAAAEMGRGRIYNIGTGAETSVRDVLDHCKNVTGVRRMDEWAPGKEGDLLRSVLDADWAARDLGWRASLSVEAGIRITWGQQA